MSKVIEDLDQAMVAEQVTAVVKQNNIADETAVTLRNQFKEFYGNIVELRDRTASITDIEDPAQQQLARDIRLGLRKERCAVENLRKQLKEDSLRRGKAIDGLANVLKYLCEPVEEKLMDIEKHVERMEAERKAALAEERKAALVAVEADPNAYNLADMNEETWAMVLAGAKKQRDDRIEAERKAEKERVERETKEREEQERIRAENAKLKAEAEKAETERKAEEAKAKAERDAIEAKARKEREAAEAVARAEREKAEAALNAERKARADAEAAIAKANMDEADRIAKEKAAADAKAKSERIAAATAAMAPDKMKLSSFALALQVMEEPAMSTEQGQKVLDEILDGRLRFTKWIQDKVRGL